MFHFRGTAIRDYKHTPPSKVKMTLFKMGTGSPPPVGTINGIKISVHIGLTISIRGVATFRSPLNKDSDENCLFLI